MAELLSADLAESRAFVRRCDAFLRLWQTTPVNEVEHALHEAAVALRVHADTAGGRLSAALLLDTFRRTRQALLDGVLGVPHALVLIDELGCLEESVALRVEAEVLSRFNVDGRLSSTPAQLRRAVHRRVVRLDPEVVARRRAAAKKKTDVRLLADRDGTADLVATGPVLTTRTAMSLVDHLARQAGAGDDRPLGQRRLAALVQALVEAAGVDVPLELELVQPVVTTVAEVVRVTGLPEPVRIRTDQQTLTAALRAAAQQLVDTRQRLAQRVPDGHTADPVPSAYEAPAGDQVPPDDQAPPDHAAPPDDQAPPDHAARDGQVPGENRGDPDDLGGPQARRDADDALEDTCGVSAAYREACAELGDSITAWWGSVESPERETEPNDDEWDDATVVDDVRVTGQLDDEDRGEPDALPDALPDASTSAAPRATSSASAAGRGGRLSTRALLALDEVAWSDDDLTGRSVELVGVGALDAHLLAEGIVQIVLTDPAALQVRRVCTDRVSGSVVAVDARPLPPEQLDELQLPEPPPGTAQYRPTAAQRRVVQGRDQHCTFPGCRVPATRCDLDHLVAWPAGPTSVANLHCLCRRHHRLKQDGWSARRTPDGHTDWTSPRRHCVRREPPIT